MLSLEPDFTADQFDEIATLPQRDTWERMQRFQQWQISHLWKRDEGDIVVWCIARIGGQWSHAFIEPDGKLTRYNQSRIRLERNKEDDG